MEEEEEAQRASCGPKWATAVSGLASRLRLVALAATGWSERHSPLCTTWV